MGWTTDLLEGVAELLATAGVGQWRPDGPPYDQGETAIVIGAMPPDPARIILLAAYPVEDNIALAHATVGLQVRTRAGPDPRDVQDLDDEVYEQLQGLTQTTFGTCHVKQMWRRSATSLGQARDGTDRWEQSSNFYAEATHATVHRPI